jgi:6-phosphogluconolactonase
MGARPDIVTKRDPDTLAIALAERIAHLSAEAGRPSAEPGPASFTIALAGGATPRRLYETLAREPFRTRVRWERLEFFFGDERAVAPDHSDSNFGMVSRALLSHVTVRTHRMPAESGDTALYERLLGERVLARHAGVPALDLVLLGIGEDGHTASLFPGTAALREQTRWVVMNDVPELGTRRMTLTYPVLNAARRVWVLAVGAAKRAIVAECLAALAAEDVTPGIAARRPIVGVRPSAGELVWWLDEAAAGPR